MLDLSNVEVVYENGIVQLEATLQAVANEISTYNTHLVSDSEQITSALTQVFDDHRGQHILKPTLIGSVLGIIKPNLESYQRMSERTAQVIDAQVQSGILTKGQGRNGGFWRTSDVPPTAAKK
jgi:hypothetical protein